LDIDAEALAESATDIRRVGGPDAALELVGDVTNPADAETAVRRAAADLGGLHILINNAGINPRLPAGTPFWDLPPEVWTRVIATNLSGAFFMARAAAVHLRTQSWGRIIGVTTSLDTMLRSAPYGPSKAGQEAFVAVMARELEGSGVTANVLVPGRATKTGMTAGSRDTDAMLDPEVMQAPAVWLASEESNGFNGRRIIAELWDEYLPIEERLQRASAPAGWPQIGRQPRSGGR
jgi:3-oxoacyl-[acyl-carrier protein] reductase